MAMRIDTLTNAQRARFDEWADRIEFSADGCWVWTGARNNGYGRIYVAGELKYAHRLVYEALVGSVPEGLHLDHVCRRRDCVRPTHLEPVTPRENQRRGIKGVLTTHCPQGHPYDTTNTLRARKAA